VNSYGETPLFYAANVVESKLKYFEKDGNMKKINNHGKSLLFGSYEEKTEAIVKYLVERGAEINKINNQGKTPLYYTIKECDRKTKQYLINHGAVCKKK